MTLKGVWYDSRAVVVTSHSKIVSSDTCSGNPLVDARDNAEEGNANGANSEGGLGIEVALESGQRTIGLRDIHGLDNEQIVVK